MPNLGARERDRSQVIYVAGLACPTGSGCPAGLALASRTLGVYLSEHFEAEWGKRAGDRMNRFYQ